MKYLSIIFVLFLTGVLHAYQTGTVNRTNFGGAPQQAAQPNYRAFSNYNSRAWNQGVQTQAVQTEPVQTAVAGSAIAPTPAPAKQAAPTGQAAAAKQAAATGQAPRNAGSEATDKSMPTAPSTSTIATYTLPANPNAAELEGAMKFVDTMTETLKNINQASAQPGMPDMSSFMGGAPAAQPAKPAAPKK